MIYTSDIIGDQWRILIGAVELGMVVGGCYDVLRIIRTAFCFGEKLYIFSDFLFCIWGGFLTFSFLLNENYGLARLYIFLGEGAGFLLWYITAGRAAKPLGRFLRRLFAPFGKMFRKISKTVGKSLFKGKKQTKSREINRKGY